MQTLIVLLFVLFWGCVHPQNKTILAEHNVVSAENIPYGAVQDTMQGKLPLFFPEHWTTDTILLNAMNSSSDTTIYDKDCMFWMGMTERGLIPDQPYRLTVPALPRLAYLSVLKIPQQSFEQMLITDMQTIESLQGITQLDRVDGKWYWLGILPLANHYTSVVVGYDYPDAMSTNDQNRRWYLLNITNGQCRSFLNVASFLDGFDGTIIREQAYLLDTNRIVVRLDWNSDQFGAYAYFHVIEIDTSGLMHSVQPIH